MDLGKLVIKLSINSILKSALIFLISVSFFIIGARGGLQLKPIKVINAGEISSPLYSSLILNSPFCFLHSFNNDKLKEYKYYDKNVVDTIYNTYRSRPDKELNKKNIKPKLIVMLVGDMKASASYVAQKEKFAVKAGIESDIMRFEATVTEEEILTQIDNINNYRWLSLSFLLYEIYIRT